VANPNTPLPPACRAYVQAVGIVGLPVLAYCVWALIRDGAPLLWVAFVIVTLIAGRLTIKVPSIQAYFAVSEIFTFTCILLFGPEAAAIALVLDLLILSWQRKLGWDRTLFNVAELTLAVWVSGQLFFLVSGGPPLFGNPVAAPVALILPLGLMAMTFYLVNTGLIALAIAFESGGQAFTIWRKHFFWLAPVHAASASVAILLIGAVQKVNLSTFDLLPALLLVPPLFLVFYFTLRTFLGRLEDAVGHVSALNRLYLSTVETLATAIDAKDEVTSDHIKRVQAGTLALAKKLGVTEELMLQAIEAAALLHDTGKIAVPEHILNKPGKLTPAEFEKMKLHAPIGATILSAIEFPYPVVPIVRHHHENWDGTGYPDGLRGTDIPLGARILSVVDCFDALTSDRPYRRRMSDDEAIQILTDRRGTMYDPMVVDAFLAIYKTIMPPADRSMHPAARAVGQAREVGRDATELAPPGSTETGVSAELLAVGSLARTIAGHASVSDVGALVWMMLRPIVPADAIAVFRNDEGSDSVSVCYAAGANASVMRGVRKARGSGVAGWAAVTRRPALNAEPSLDFGYAIAEGETPLVASITLPLVHEGMVVAVLGLYSSERTGFSEDRLRLLELVAPSLAASFAGVMGSDALQPVGVGARRPAPDLRLLKR
jgi:putative nucleotidyltransferase with HDIG domain